MQIWCSRKNFVQVLGTHQMSSFGHFAKCMSRYLTHQMGLLMSPHLPALALLSWMCTCRSGQGDMAISDTSAGAADVTTPACLAPDQLNMHMQVHTPATLEVHTVGSRTQQPWGHLAGIRLQRTITQPQQMGASSCTWATSLSGTIQPMQLMRRSSPYP